MSLSYIAKNENSKQKNPKPTTPKQETQVKCSVGQEMGDLRISLVKEHIYAAEKCVSVNFKATRKAQGRTSEKVKG